MNVSEKQLRNWCDEYGLVYFGTIVPEAEQAFKNFKAWLDGGYHAGMAFLERYQEVREAPEKILPGTRSVIVFGMPYGQGDKLRSPERARVAQYARLRDYHKYMRKQAERVWTKLRDSLGDLNAEARVVVDTAPVLERALAAQTGRGFVGKNTIFIHPVYGSLMFLGEIFTTAQLDIDCEGSVAPQTRTERGGCGSCKRCQVHCPTGALDEAYKLDANKCIAYWTIEHRGTIPREHWHMLAHYVFGCDICQIVCPYNRPANNKVAKQAPASLVKMHRRPALAEIATMSQTFYVSTFGGTPMTRAKREGLMRNALIAMFELDDESLPRCIEELTHREDCPETVLATIAQIQNS